MEDAKTVSNVQGRPASRRVSRRTLMKTGAGVGIAAAVGTAGVAFAGPTQQTATGAKPTGADGHSTDGTVVVHILDASKGTAEVFTSSARKQIKDRDLVARIVRAART
jgi:hypothetical protein